MTSEITKIERRKKMSLNRAVLLAFSLLVMILGFLGFLIPPESSLLSGAAVYNTFHIITGFVGIIFWLANKERRAETFNIGFGLIDLYQAFASYQNLFPEQYFRWSNVDTALHIIVGLLLIAVGCYGIANRNMKTEKQF